MRQLLEDDDVDRFALEYIFAEVTGRNPADELHDLYRQGVVESHLFANLRLQLRACARPEDGFDRIARHHVDHRVQQRYRDNDDQHAKQNSFAEVHPHNYFQLILKPFDQLASKGDSYSRNLNQPLEWAFVRITGISESYTKLQFHDIQRPNVLSTMKNTSTLNLQAISCLRYTDT